MLQDNVRKVMYEELRHAMLIIVNAEKLLDAEGGEDRKNAKKLEKISSELLHFIEDFEKGAMSCN